eukprot:6203156-Pleurochrysis_carterae.AAC.4
MAPLASMPGVTVEAASRERQALDAAAKAVRRAKRATGSPNNHYVSPPIWPVDFTSLNLVR